MSDILMAGLSDQEAAAIEILVGMTWDNVQVVSIKRSLSLAIPEQGMEARACEVCVIDLFGLGMRRHSPENAQRLMGFLKGRPAVLLVWGSGGGWLESGLQKSSSQHLVWIAMPYTSTQMVDAIDSARESLEDTSSRCSDWVSSSAAALTSEANTKKSLSHPSSSDSVEQLAQLPAWRRAMKLAEQLQAQTLRRTDRQFNAASSLEESVQPITPGSIAPQLAASPTPADPPVGLRKGAFQVLLDSFPELEPHPLMAICARTPQSVGDLVRAFPKDKLAVYRFAILTVLSGAGVVSPSSDSGFTLLAPSLSLRSGANHGSKARRGFFKSLLEKLF